MGPQDSIDDLLRLAPLFPGMQLMPWPYGDERETVATARRVLATRPRPDVILFTGPIPYYHAREALSPSIPMLFVPFTGAALYRVLFVAKGVFALDGLSVDTVPEAEVRDTLRELGLPLDRIQVFTLSYETAIDRTKFVEFHRAHHQAGRTTLALTCLRSAHEMLRTLDVPCLRIVPPRSVLVATLEKAALLGNVEQARERQLVVGYVEAHPAQTQSGDEEPQSLERVDSRLASLDPMIQRVVGEMCGICVRTKRARWKFVTTRAFLGDLDRVPLDRFRLSGWRVAIGIGMGVTAHQADGHAELALQHARQAMRDGPVAYLVLENKQVVGPIGQGDHPITFSARAIDPGILGLAGRTGLNATLLNRVVGAVQQLRQGSFAAEELAPFLGVSTRTARRVLRRLAEGGAVEVVGQDRAHRRGKPRRLFRMRWFPNLDMGVTIEPASGAGLASVGSPVATVEEPRS